MGPYFVEVGNSLIVLVLLVCSLISGGLGVSGAIIEKGNMTTAELVIPSPINVRVGASNICVIIGHKRA